MAVKDQVHVSDYQRMLFACVFPGKVSVCMCNMCGSTLNNATTLPSEYIRKSAPFPRTSNVCTSLTAGMTGAFTVPTTK